MFTLKMRVAVRGDKGVMLEGTEFLEGIEVPSDQRKGTGLVEERTAEALRSRRRARRDAEGTG